jgi:hypothetical protein
VFGYGSPFNLLTFEQSNDRPSVSVRLGCCRRRETQIVTIPIRVEEEMPNKDSPEELTVACGVYYLEQKCSGGHVRSADGKLDPKGSLESPIVPKKTFTPALVESVSTIV